MNFIQWKSQIGILDQKCPIREDPMPCSTTTRAPHLPTGLLVLRYRLCDGVSGGLSSGLAEGHSEVNIKWFYFFTFFLKIIILNGVIMY